MNKGELKVLLKTVKENNYEVPKGYKSFDLALEMVEYLGDTDGELRDKLCFSILSKWIIDNVLTKEEIYKILYICLDENHLLCGLGKTDDTSFVRAFSVLIVGSVLYNHRHDKFLSKNDIDIIFEKVIKFYDEDIDVRGYVEGKGWIDGVCHGADTLDELARCEEIDYNDLKRILSSIHNKIIISKYGYIYEEDERIVTAVVSVLERKQIPEVEIIQWIKSFEKMTEVKVYPHDLIIYVNVKNLFRSLYFRLNNRFEFQNIVDVLHEILENTNRYKNNTYN